MTLIIIWISGRKVNFKLDLCNLSGFANALSTIVCPRESINITCQIQIRIPPKSEKLLESTLLMDIPHSVIVQNLQDALDEQLAPLDDLSRSTKPKGFYAAYRTYEEIVDYVGELHAQFPELTTIEYLPGKTYEERQIISFKISGPGRTTKKTEKNVVVMNGGMHAREWIAPASVLFMANSLLEGYKAGDSLITSLVNNLEFHIIPVLNVDGYIWSHTKARMWRKNRQPNNGSSCIGTDPNRNFEFKFLNGGSSTDPCSEVFAGPDSFSAPEARAIASYVESFENRVLFYADIHSFSQLW